MQRGVERALKPLIVGMGLAAICGLAASAETVAKEYLGRYIWAAPAVGGISGLEVSPNGDSFVAVSDRGTRYDGHFRREGDVITGLDIQTSHPIRKTNGQPVTGGAVDAEGLACPTPHPAASCDISFEMIHRVAFFATPTSAARNRPQSPAIKSLQRNSGLEALALDPQGRLIAIPERSGELERPFPVYRLEGRRWTTPYHLRREAPYLVVGADFGPDGKLYVLERHFAAIAFSSRVRRFTIAEDRVVDEELVFRSAFGEFDNLEGIAVWRDTSGAIRLTMVSDDNFNAFQRTEFIEYRLGPDGGTSPQP